MDIPIPYEGDQPLEIDPAARQTGYQHAVGILQEILDSHDGVVGDDEELERIMRGAVILFHANAGTLAECIHTAVIWERG